MPFRDRLYLGRRCALAAALLVLASPASRAQPLPAGTLAAHALFVPPVRDGRACYERSYAQAHLAAHPRQSITRMRLRVDFFRTGGADEAPEGHYGVAIEAWLRGREHPFDSAFHCRPAAGGLSCRIDCRGTAIRLARPDSGGRVQVALARDPGLSAICDNAEDAARTLRPGADDRLFLLSALPPERCPPFPATRGSP